MGIKLCNRPDISKMVATKKEFSAKFDIQNLNVLYSIFRKMWKYYQIFQVGILIQIPGKKTTEEVV